MRDPRREEAKPDERIEVTEAAAPPERVPVCDAERGGEERFRALAEHAGDAIMEITADAHITYVNPSFTEHYGYPAEEVVGASAFGFIHPEDAGEVEAIRAHAMAEKAAAQLLFRVRHRDGSWRWMEMAGRPYHTSSGELRAVLVARDVTERIRAEHALQRQLEIETRIADLSRRFLNLESDDFEACLRQGLESAAEVAGAQRVQFLLRSGSSPVTNIHYQWSAEGLEPYLRGDPEATARSHRWLVEKLLAGELIHLPRLAELPPEAGAERSALERQGVRSYLAIPILDDGRALGFLDFQRMREEKGWSSHEITRLWLIADVLGSAVRRLRAEQERRATEERFRTLTQRARDTICEVSLDGRVHFASANFDELSGYTQRELVNVDPWSLVHPDDREELRRLADLATQGGEASPLTFRLRHRDGGWRWVESTASSFAAASGERRLAVVIRDVTERHQQRLKLERQLELERRVADFSRALLERGADEIDAGIQHGLEAAAALADADRSYLVSALGGDGRREAVYNWQAPGVPPREHELGLPREKQEWVLERLLAGELVRLSRVEDLPDEARHVRESLIEGGIRSFLCIPINSEGKLLGVLGFHCLRRQKDWSEREITLLRLVADLFTSALRRKRAEMRFRESQLWLLQAQKMEAVGTLAGGIAHDFNNQLTVMLANSRYVRRRVGGDEELDRALEDLHRAAEHCAQLTRSLLAFSRQTPVSPRSVDVAVLVAEVEELLRPLVPSSIAFEVRGPPSPARILADPTQLQQVLVNLVVNARDAMPAGGYLMLEAAARVVGSAEASRLGLAVPGPYMELSVRDTGAGMDDEVRSRIFEPFFSTKAPGQGTGLGLATAYGIVQQCGGVISVDSQPGRGSIFRVLIPQSLEPGSDGEEGSASGARRARGTLLLAEDEPRVRRLLARMLREGGYEVVEAGDGVEALRLGRQNAERLDALVTDLDMPRLGGVELARRLMRRRAKLPVLFISGTAPCPQDRDHAGAPVEGSRFLGKPFTECDLLDALHALLSDIRSPG